MHSTVVLKLDNDTYFEMPLLQDLLASHDLRLLEDSLENALPAITEHAPGVIVTGAAAIGRDIINIALDHGLLGIVKAGAGMDNIDAAYARSKGVVVTNTATYAAETVAEYAVSLMLSLSRKLVPLQTAIRQQGWVGATPAWLGNELFQKTIGLVGFGHIAKSVSRIAHYGFQMSVLAYDPYVSAEEMAEFGVQKVDDLEQLLPVSDIVSIHCPLNAATQNMIGAEQLRLMQPSALLVNVSRGGLIDEASLLLALSQEKIGGVALDVYAKEPLDITTDAVISQMASMKNVVLSSHLAWYTAEASKRLQQLVTQSCIDIMKGVIQ